MSMSQPEPFLPLFSLSIFYIYSYSLFFPSSSLFLPTLSTVSFRVCTERSLFRFPEVRIGIIPGALGTQLLPRLAGFEKAISMCVGCELVDAKDALKSGIVDQIIPDFPSNRNIKNNGNNGNMNSWSSCFTRKNAKDLTDNTVNSEPNGAEDVNSTDVFTERMVRVLENQILRGPMSPTPFRRTRCCQFLVHNNY